MNHKRPQTLLEFVNQIPPFLILPLARKPGAPRKGMTVEELSLTSGIPVRTLERVLAYDNWDRVRIGLVSRLIAAAGLPLMNHARVRQYIKSTAEREKPFRHLSTQQRNSLFGRMARVTAPEPQAPVSEEVKPSDDMPQLGSPEDEFATLVGGQAEP